MAWMKKVGLVVLGTVLLTSWGSCDCPCDDPADCKLITNIPKKEIFAFTSTNSDVWKKFNWSMITTVSSLSLSAELTCFAHKHGARSVILVDYPKLGLTNVTQRNIWTKQQVALVQNNFLDGINIDFEEVIFEWETEFRDGLTALVRETAAAVRAVNPYAQITVDVVHTPEHPYFAYDYAALAAISDFFFLMCYDELIHVLLAKATSPYPETIQGILAYEQLPNVTGSKLVLGVPWFGYDYPCADMLPNDVCVQPAEYFHKQLNVKAGWDSALRFRHQPFYRRRHAITRGLQLNNGVQRYYSTIINMLKVNSTSGRRWDESSQSPFYDYQSTDDGMTHQVWYDDPESLTEKYKLVNSLNIRGAGMFRADIIDYSDTPEGRKEQREMWGALTVIHMN